jgi:hypothetical protein
MAYAAHNFFEKLDDEKTKIDNAVKAYTTAMGFLTATITVEVLKDTREITKNEKERTEMEKKQNILKWIWDGNYWDRHRLLHVERVTGTGQWFLDSDTFKEWRKGEKANFLICPGIRIRTRNKADFSWGRKIIYGVSMLCCVKANFRSLVIDNLHPFTNSLNRKKTGVVHFYFEYSNRKQQRTKDFIRCLIKQLIYQLDTIPDSVVTVYNRVSKDGPGAEPNDIQLSELLKDCFSTFSTVFIIVDAFDECEESERRQVMNVLEKLPNSKLRLCVTGRPVVLDFENYDKNDHMGVWLKGARRQQISANETDVVNYLEKELNDPSLGSDEVSKRRKKGIVREIASRMDGQ